MILTDTGPLVALLDADDKNHRRCMGALKSLPAHPMLTTWPCFTEAIYLLGSIGRYHYQSKLWQLYTTDRVYIHTFSSAEIHRIHRLMELYQDTPMDMADASLIAVAESLNHERIFSLDSDFYIYRLQNGSMLTLIP